MPEVIILTGPPAAGKSAVARALAERYDRVAHVEVDVLRDFITPTGHVHPWGPTAAWERQQRLGIRNACALAANFLDERFAVIIDDVVIDKDNLDYYLAGLNHLGVPVHFVRLMPSLAVCQERNQARAEGRMAPERIVKVYREFEAAGAFAGATVDSSDLTPYAAADKLQALTTSGGSLLWRLA